MEDSKVHGQNTAINWWNKDINSRKLSKSIWDDNSENSTGDPRNIHLKDLGTTLRGDKSKNLPSY